MYTVNVGKTSSQASSFTAAKDAVRTLAVNFAEGLLNSNADSLRKIYRSPKAANRVADARKLQAGRIINDNSRLPAKAGSYSGKIGSLSWAISRT